MNNFKLLFILYSFYIFLCYLLNLILPTLDIIEKHIHFSLIYVSIYVINEFFFFLQGQCLNFKHKKIIILKINNKKKANKLSYSIQTCSNQ